MLTIEVLAALMLTGISSVIIAFVIVCDRTSGAPARADDQPAVEEALPLRRAA